MSGDAAYTFPPPVRDYADPARFRFAFKNDLDILEDKDFKEIKYLSDGWVDRSYVQYANSADTTGTTVYAGPNGNPNDNSGYFTQK